MARDADGQLIDPFGGQRDLQAGVLRHVSDAFIEDPVRILRVARCAARFGFVVAPETAALMQRMSSIPSVPPPAASITGPWTAPRPYKSREQLEAEGMLQQANASAGPAEIGRAHVLTPVT